MTERRGTIRIGTSGWTYPHWRGPFYPKDLPDDHRLPFYAERLASVEINNSFYHLPERKTLEHWREATPAGFVFTAKASRYITHMKKLKDADESVPNFMDRIDILGDKLGAILFQLPPRWRANLDRLQSFLGILDGDHRYALEFRDESWFDDRVYDLLEQHGCAFCIYELAGRQSPKQVTADFVYVRLHGPGEAYEGNYDAIALSGWAGALSSWASSGKDVFCYFDNDEAGYAPHNAVQLAKMLE
jgi:uncharacterized protein YecE (DUF72 family)